MNNFLKRLLNKKMTLFNIPVLYLLLSAIGVSALLVGYVSITGMFTAQAGEPKALVFTQDIAITQGEQIWTVSPYIVFAQDGHAVFTLDDSLITGVGCDYLPGSDFKMQITADNFGHFCELTDEPCTWPTVKGGQIELKIKTIPATDICQLTGSYKITMIYTP